MRGSLRSSVGVALVLLGSLATILLVGHGLTFRHDEWDLIQGRYRGGASTFLEPLNEHISIVPIAVYRVLLHTAGLDNYFWYRFVLVLFDTAGGYLLWILLRRRVPAALAIGLTAVIVFCGAAYENFLFPIQIGQVGSLVGALGAWVALDGESRRGSSSSFVMLAVAFSLASSAIGVAVLIGVGVEVVMRRRWTLLAGLLSLAALFALWYLSYGRSSGVTSLSAIPGFLSGLVAYTLTGTVGLWPLYHLPHSALILAGLVVALGGVGVAVLGTKREWWPAHQNRSLPRLVGMLATLAIYWLLVAASRSGLTPYRSRYMEPGAIVLVLLVAELLGRRLPRRTVATLLVGCCLIVAANLPYLVHNAAKYRLESQILSAQVGALERAHNVPSNFEPAPTTDPQIKAGALLRAEHALSSRAGASAQAISQMPAQARAAAAAVQPAIP